MSFNPASPGAYDSHNDMAIAALMWALDEPVRERRRLLDGYKARRVTICDPWDRTVDTLVNERAGYDDTAEAWIIRQYFSAPSRTTYRADHVAAVRSLASRVEGPK
jgi:hypothetical protein